jgi:hypothetical protein
MPRKILLALIAAAIATPLAAAEIVLTLDDVTVGSCDVPFVEAECTMSFIATTGEDATPGFCLFIADANNFGKEGVYLYPSRLVLDLTNLEGLESVEVDVWETHVAGSTRAFLYDAEGAVDNMNSFMEDDQTLTLEAGGSVPTQLAVSAHEAYVWEIRLIGSDIAPVDGVTFSTVKALYR